MIANFFWKVMAIRRPDRKFSDHRQCSEVVFVVELSLSMGDLQGGGNRWEWSGMEFGSTYKDDTSLWGSVRQMEERINETQFCK